MPVIAPVCFGAADGRGFSWYQQNHVI